MLSGSDPD
jgi:hypothetical protein